MDYKFRGIALTSVLALSLAGCESMDGLMASTGDALDGMGDVLSGDFRGLGEARETTLGEIWSDWQQNEVAAKRKWETQTLIIPGVVTRITKADGGLESMIAVIFRDPTNAQCTGQALMRDDLMVSEKRVSHLKTGDRVKISGVLGTTASKWSDMSCWFSFSKAKISLEATR